MSLSEILTPSFVKQQFLQQVRTTDKKGNELPESFYQVFIDSSIDQLEAELSIVLTGSPYAEHTERKDSFDWYSSTWYLKDLIRRPIAQVTWFGVQYGNFPEAEIPLSWFMLRDHIGGVFQVTLGPGSYALPPFPFLSGFGMGRQYDPAWIRVKYIAGFVKPLSGLFTTTAGTTAVVVAPATGETVSDILRDTKAGGWIKIGTDPTVYQVRGVTSTQVILATPAAMSQASVSALAYAYDPMLVETAGILATIPILETIAAYLYGGPGIAGKSLGIDGMTQSKPLAVAPGRGVYSALQQTYLDRATANMEALMRRYDRVKLFAL